MAARRRATGRATATSALFGRLTAGGERNLLDTLRAEKAGGTLLLLGAVVALVWASSPWRDGYEAMRGTVVGPAALHLDLTLEHWATDGLLTIFFFVVGLELKREVVAGELRRPATALVPIVAAVGGMAAPALIYVAVNATAADGDLAGWAIPTATDIAFAVAVLAVVGRNLPNSLRAFLLTLAVVDDLLAIVVIAVVYSDDIALGWLAASLAACAVFGLLVRRRVTTAWVLLPVGLAAWGFMHASGVHATIAGVVLGFTVPALAPDDEPSLAERFEHRWRPLSAGVAVPVFALFAAGVALDPATLREALGDPVAQGVALGLVLGKPIGIVTATWLTAKATRLRFSPGVTWADIAGLGLVGGIGFTVSLLIGALAFGEGSERDDHIRAAILVASLTAAVLGATVLAWRDRHHASLADGLRDGPADR
ncbi:Na+/H+ antiporter NhaA [Actinotalea fermentans]|uniref:Na(+)/H(+) antiporter NhaA n=1 Tax=Actinotalea fermentans TaxID=43671 RepID=A0A511Z0N9_9CELL|nr:Na+/H+ antiporter NhaA [Actinotalea fermentans]KGM16757.1 Na(+)/H(+) antiporter NhaA [Actinotalea fermentans ATCC 43279 = JCM 9966 = DSM 3133]GEN81020.1 Na(+)/H(+) antiporter NhaA [Actinotalea fermentans]